GRADRRISYLRDSRCGRIWSVGAGRWPIRLAGLCLHRYICCHANGSTDCIQPEGNDKNALLRDRLHLIDARVAVAHLGESVAGGKICWSRWRRLCGARGTDRRGARNFTSCGGKNGDRRASSPSRQTQSISHRSGTSVIAATYDTRPAALRIFFGKAVGSPARNWSAVDADSSTLSVRGGRGMGEFGLQPASVGVVRHGTAVDCDALLYAARCAAGSRYAAVAPTPRNFSLRLG